MGKEGTILLVNKDHIFNDLVVQAVASEAYQVIACPEPDRAGEFVTQEVNLVIFDASVPNGAELMEQIRSVFPSTKIIALVDSDTALEAIRLQKIGIVDKRGTLEALLNAIRLALKAAPWFRSSDSYRVLVVDDEEAITDMVCEFLEKNGYAVCVAKDGKEALARVYRVTTKKAGNVWVSHHLRLCESMT